MKFLAAGASVRGPAHEQDGTPNQDAICVRPRGKGYFAAVADGLGSRRFSHVGSKRAVDLAHMISLGAKGKADTSVANRLSTAWQDSFSGLHDDYETTCIWAWVSSDGQGVVGQVGDGLALIRSQGKFRVLTQPKDGFGNQTTTLSQAGLSAGCSLDVALTSPGDGILMMTDGISDDLIPEQLESFFDAIYRRQQRSNKRRMKRWFETELQHWTTPRHGDDKTIASIFRMD